MRPKENREDRVTVEMVENVVAKMARIPPKSVSSSDRDVLRTLERDLKLTIFGQDAAIAALSSAIKMARSGLRAGWVRTGPLPVVPLHLQRLDLHR